MAKTPKTPADRPSADTAAPEPAKPKNGAPERSGKPRTTRAKTRAAEAHPTAAATGAPSFEHKPVDTAGPRQPTAGPATDSLTDFERGLLGDLLAVIEEHSSDAAEDINRELLERAFVFSCEHHADQRRRSGEDFIIHPVGVAKICAGMRLDTETLCAALLHDTVEDTSASLDEVRERYGEEVATLVDGVTKLTGITFTSRDEAQAENYRKMMIAMATDIRVILIKLADRLHNM